MNDKRTVSEPIPAISFDSEIGSIIYDALSNDRYKNKIREMITDYTNTVQFEELIMKYASKEYDNRILKSGKFWFSTIVAAIITSLIATLIALSLGQK